MKKMKKMKKDRTKYTNIFYQLLKTGSNPEIIIEFIYKNLYELIKEINYIKDELYYKLQSKYEYYYYYYYLKSKSEDLNWFLTLFPDPRINHYGLNLKKLYIGSTGRLLYFSICDPCFYWYGDPTNWIISNNLSINDKNQVRISRCQFMLLEYYNERAVNEEIAAEQFSAFRFIIYKKVSPGIKLSYINDYDEFPDDYKMLRHAKYYFEEEWFKKMLNRYKLNVKNEAEKIEAVEKGEKISKYEYKSLGYSTRLAELWKNKKKDEIKEREKEIFPLESLEEPRNYNYDDIPPPCFEIYYEEVESSVKKKKSILPLQINANA